MGQLITPSEEQLQNKGLDLEKILSIREGKPLPKPKKVEGVLATLEKREGLPLQILEEFPEILDKHPKRLGDCIDFICNNLHITLQQIEEHPELLTKGVRHFKLRRDYLAFDLGIALPAVRENVDLLLLEDRELIDSHTFLQDRDITDTNIARHPYLLLFDVTSQLEPRYNYFIEELRIKPKSLQRHPYLLARPTQDVEESFEILTKKFKIRHSRIIQCPHLLKKSKFSLEMLYRDLTSQSIYGQARDLYEEPNLEQSLQRFDPKVFSRNPQLIFLEPGEIKAMQQYLKKKRISPDVVYQVPTILLRSKKEIDEIYRLVTQAGFPASVFTDLPKLLVKPANDKKLYYKLHHLGPKTLGFEQGHYIRNPDLARVVLDGNCPHRLQSLINQGFTRDQYLLFPQLFIYSPPELKGRIKHLKENGVSRSEYLANPRLILEINSKIDYSQVTRRQRRRKSS